MANEAAPALARPAPSPRQRARPRITQALLSAAGRRTALDTSAQPKVLLDIEGSPLIAHVLRQLHAGGIKRVVVVVSYHGAATVLALERQARELPGLRIEVVDLGPHHQGFYAKSLLAAREHCSVSDDEPGVLLATADHIFDDALVTEMCSFELRPDETEVAVLVDYSNTPFVGLPDTAVAVRRSGDSRVLELSRDLAHPAVRGHALQDGVGIEAGLFACTGALFDSLAELSASRDYFTLMDALQDLAGKGQVASVATTGRRWVAVETSLELEGLRVKVPSCSPRSTITSSGSECELMEPVPVVFIGGDRGRCF